MGALGPTRGLTTAGPKAAALYVCHSDELLMSIAALLLTAVEGEGFLAVVVLMGIRGLSLLMFVALLVLDLFKRPFWVALLLLLFGLGRFECLPFVALILAFFSLEEVEVLSETLLRVVGADSRS